MVGRRIAWLLLAACWLTACGGGGGDTSSGSGNSGGTQPPSGIGSAGGTVNGPNGAKVVVPAGALSQSTNIAVAQSSTGAPALPSGLTAVGEMFALTPHGTQFATPVTITIPFNAAATNGATPLLYKTNAQGNWETVAGATFDAGMATAQISSFSHAQVVIPPLTGNAPTRSWTFRLVPGDGSEEIELDNDSLVGGDLDVVVDFGESSSLTAEFTRLNETVREDFVANGFVFGTNNGVTYGALAEAPDGRLGTPEPIGSTTFYSQGQSFIKNADDARLRYTITAVTIFTEDFNPPLLTGPAADHARARFLAQSGLSRVESGDIDAAETELRRALELVKSLGLHPDPLQADARVALARVHLKRSQPAHAVQLLKEAGEFWRDFDPQNPAAKETARWLGLATDRARS